LHPLVVGVLQGLRNALLLLLVVGLSRLDVVFLDLQLLDLLLQLEDLSHGPLNSLHVVDEGGGDQLRNSLIVLSNLPALFAHKLKLFVLKGDDLGCVVLEGVSLGDLGELAGVPVEE